MGARVCSTIAALMVRKRSIFLAFKLIGALGRTFDAMGDGTKSKYFNLDQFKASIDHHLLKGNTFTVIDMTGYTADQISPVKAYVDTLPGAKIIRIGF